MVEYPVESFLTGAFVALAAGNESPCVRNRREFDKRRVRLFARVATLGGEEMEPEKAIARDLEAPMSETVVTPVIPSKYIGDLTIYRRNQLTI